MANFQGISVLSALFSFVRIVGGSEYGPSFALQPQDSIAYRTGSLTLYCLPRHNNSIVRWYKDEVSLSLGPAGLPQHTEYANGSLEIVVDAAGDSDGIKSIEGSYYCTITNDQGSARSRNVQVKVHRVFEIEKPQTQVLYIDEAVILAQGVFGRLEESFWTMTCDDVSLKCPGSNCPFLYSVSVVGRLQTYSVFRFTHKELQKAIPSCNSSTTVAIRNVTNSVRLNIIFDAAHFAPRRILPEKAVLAVQAGQNIILYCISNSITTSYRWTKGGEPLNINTGSRVSYVTNTTGFLKIQNVSSEDAGHYVCTYTTDYPGSGEDTKTRSFDVVVYRLPTVRLNVSKNADGLYVTCIIAGSQPLHVQILRDLSVIYSQTLTNQTDTVQFGRLVSSGVYQCLVSNEYGSEQSSQFIEVPVETSTVVMTSVQSTSTVGPLSSLGSLESSLPTVLFFVDSSLFDVSTSFYAPMSSLVTSTAFGELTPKGSSVQSNTQLSPSLSVPIPSAPAPTTPQASTTSSTTFTSLSLTQASQPTSMLPPKYSSTPSSTSSTLSSSALTSLLLPTAASTVLSFLPLESSSLAPVSTQTSTFVSSSAPPLSMSRLSSVQSVETKPPTAFSPSLRSTATYTIGNTSMSVVLAASDNITTLFSTQVPRSHLIDSTPSSPTMTSQLELSVEATVIHSLSLSTRSATVSSRSPTSSSTLESPPIDSTPPSPTITSQSELSPQATVIYSLSSSTRSATVFRPSPRPTATYGIGETLVSLGLTASDNTTFPFSSQLLATQLINSSMPSRPILTYSPVSTRNIVATMSPTSIIPGVGVTSQPSTVSVQQTARPEKTKESDDGFPIVIVAAAAGGGILFLLLLTLLILCLCRRKKSQKNSYLVANAPGTTSTVIDLAIFKNEATSGEQETNGYSAVESAEDTEVGDTCIDDETGGYATVAFNPATAVVANGAHYKVPRSPPPAIEGTAVTNESHYQVPRSPPPAIESTAVTNESHYQVPRSPPPTIESAAVANGNHFPPPTSESGYDRLLPKTKTESQYDRLRPKTVSASTEGNDSSVKTQQSDNIPKTQLNNGKEVDDHHYTAGGDLYAAPTLTKPRPLPRKKTPREKEESDEQPNIETSAGTDENGIDPQGLHYLAGDDVYAVSGKLPTARKRRDKPNNPDKPK